MSNSLGVKETKEVLDFAFLVTSTIVDEVKKDGFQWTDLAAVLKSPDFDATVLKAVEGYEQIPAEVKDLSFFEGLELSRYVYGKAMDILEKIKED